MEAASGLSITTYTANFCFRAKILASKGAKLSPERVKAFEEETRASKDSDGALNITVEIAIELGGRRYEGRHTGQDLVECSLNAWLDAATQAQG